MSKTCIDLHTPYLKSKFNKLIKSGVKEKDAELEIALEEAKRIFNSLNSLKTKLGLKLSEEDEITNAIVTAKAEDFQDLSETFDLEGELKTKIAALEKIIKDAESEDAPATVKQKLIEKGNAKLAEMKAELATMQQSKNETSSTDNKKAEIERRFPEYVKNFKQSIYDIRDIVRRLGRTNAISKASIFDNVEDKFAGKTITGDNIHEAIKGIAVLGSKGFKRTFIADIIQEFNNIIELKKEYDAEIAALTKQNISKPLNISKALKDLKEISYGTYGDYIHNQNGIEYKGEVVITNSDYRRNYEVKGKNALDAIKDHIEKRRQEELTNIWEKNDVKIVRLKAEQARAFANLQRQNKQTVEQAEEREKTYNNLLEKYKNEINIKYDAELAALTKQDTSETEVSGKEQLDALFGEVVTPQPTEKQETPIEKLRRLAKEKIEESKLQSTSEFNYRGGTYTIDYNRNLLSPIPKTTAAQKNLIDSIGKQDIYDVINSTINSKDVYLVFNKNLNKFVVLDKNLNSIPLDESVVTSKAYQDAKNRCK